MEDPLQLLHSFMAPEPLTLTFGVELEFILRFKPANYTLSRGDSDGWFSCLEEAAKDHVVSVLNKNGHAVYGGDEQPGPCYEKWDLGRDTSIHIPELWLPTDENGFDYCEIELRSPALPHATASLSQIKEAFELLFSTFDIQVNESCGLHVHVGNERKGFPLQTLKNFCILTTMFERELESLHPPSRVGNTYSKSSGALFVGVSPSDVEKIIKSTYDLNDLISRVQNNDKRHAYNLLNLRENKKTIEFRQHEATVNVDDIIRWVELTCSLVEKAHEPAMKDYHDLDQTDLRRYHLDAFLDKIYNLPDRSILHVLASLGLDGLADYYSSRGLYTHPKPAWAWADPSQEDVMTPWIESDYCTEYMDGEEIDRSLRTEYVNGERIIKSVANSKENRVIYWNAVLRCASDTAIHVPCEYDSAIGSECSWECFCDCWDCQARAESQSNASASARGWNSAPIS